MPLQSSTPTKEKRAAVCHAGTPTPALRRVPVKPLGESNRSRSHSPALGSLSVKDKRTPARGQQKTMLTGVDLTRRFADSVHGATTTRGAGDFRSPRGSPSLDRIQEGCSSSMGRERKGSGTGFKSRLRGGEDTPPVKKAITFTTPFGKEKSSVRKHDKVVKRKDLTEHFVLEVKKEDVGLSSLAPPMSSMKPYVERHGGRDVDSKEAGLVEVARKLPLFSDLAMSKSIGLRGRVVGNDGKVSLMETLGARSSMHEKLAMGIGHRSFGAREGRSFAEDVPCRLAFDAIELSPQGPKSVGAQSSGIEVWEDARLRVAAPMSPQQDEGDADAMPLPLPCNSPEVCNRGSVVGEGGLPWDFQEDSVAQEWFRSRDMACFESFSMASKTPEPQVSKSPEMSRRAVGLPGVGALLEGAEGERQEDFANQQTPSPQPTSSPEFLKRGSVPPSTGGCFGAGPLMGPEGMRSVKDRRKCKPRGILTIEGEFLFTSGSADFLEEDVQIKETITVPALASVEWMVAEGYDVEPVDPPGSSPNRDMRDMDVSPKLVSPGSFSHLRDLGERESTVPGHRRCRSAVESGSDQIFWKKGLLYEWNLSLSDQKRAESLSPSVPEEASASPVGRLRDFSPEITPGPSRLSNFMGSSLVIGALGSVTNTPSSCRGASDFAEEDEVESKHVPSAIKIDHRNGEDHVKGLELVEKTFHELSLDRQAPHLSMSFSLDSSPESVESWRGIHTSQSTAWGDSQGDDSQGEWGEYLRNNRYKGFNSQFRFHSSREELTPVAKVDSYTRALSREVSPSTHSEGYSDDGDSVVCTPSSTGATDFENPPQTHGRESPYRDSWKKFCTVDKNVKGVGMAKDSEQISRETSPDLVGISISISDAPSLDSSSDDFEVLRYHHSQTHPTLAEREEETKAPRGRLLLHEADYSPSSLLKADAFRASISVQPRGC
ncbi:hypothetical protein KC19_4G053300 [Ceratodon purpureus]|uniref:Uncharacterized protein n=1 Tax=Ceratodon purpureus TaxID=3225 RepID=A0A8T0I7A7_CERPU|nr:hypothetical protein KC19_4G053300 [Ceratodon purpureus]